MLPVAVAAVVGFGIGVLRPPHGRHLATPHLNARLAALVGVSLQLSLTFTSGDWQGWLLAASLVCFAAFTLWNRHLVGMGLVSVGLILNVVVIGLNGAMPVRPVALVTSGAVAIEDLATTDLGAGRRFEEVDDIVAWLGDAIPVDVFGAAMSFGDLIILAGVAVLAGDLARYTRRGARTSSPTSRAVQVRRSSSGR